jgi:outer membrane protein assembly factor BamB
MKHFSLKFAVLVCAITLSGCSTLSWLNPFSKTETKNLPAVLEEFKPSLSAKTLWATSVGKSGDYVFSPALVEQNVYVAAADGNLMKLDVASGHAIWRVNADTPLTAGVAADQSIVAVVGRKGNLLVFNTDGKLRWKAQASSEILAAPAIGFGLVVVRSIDNRIAAYDAETGVRKWAIDRPLPPLILRTSAGITLTEKFALVATPGGKLLALALNNGSVRWEGAIGEPKGATELERVADLTGTPIVVGNDVCSVTFQGRVGCYDTALGTLRWAKNISSEVGVSVDERFIFAVDSVGAVFAYAKNTGASVWRNDKLLNRRISTPTSLGRAVVVGDGFGFVHFLSREDGAFLARVATDGGQISAAPLIAGSNLIVQTKSGAVVAIATE